MDNYSHLKPADIAAAITPRNLLAEPGREDPKPAARQVTDWIVEKLQGMTAENWKDTKAELLNQTKLTI